MHELQAIGGTAFARRGAAVAVGRVFRGHIASDAASRSQSVVPLPAGAVLRLRAGTG